MNGTTINDLSVGLLSEILIRMDAKTAHRSKCVSTLWRAEISTPNFVRRYIDHRMSLVRRGDLGLSSLPFINVPRNIHHLDILQSNGKTSYLSDDLFGPEGLRLNFLPISGSGGDVFEVHGASNDLLLCHVGVNGKIRAGRPDEATKERWYVCNVFTKKWNELPRPPWTSNPSPGCVLFTGLVSYPIYRVAGENNNLGINCDHALDSHYRVVLVVVIESGSHLEIFSSETNEWRVLNLGFHFRVPYAWSHSACLCDGRLLWSCLCLTAEEGGPQIFEYDPFLGDFHALFRIPDNVDSVHNSVARTRMFTGVSRGRFHILSEVTNYEGIDRVTILIRVWEMRAADDFHRVYEVVFPEEWTILGVAFHPFKPYKVYIWGTDNWARGNLRKERWKIQTWESVYAGQVFTLVKPWLPTPLPALPEM